MGKQDKKKRKKKDKPAPPASNYPAPPHIVGMDWVDWPVSDPKQSQEAYLSIGFTPRGSVGKDPLVAVGGTVLRLRRATKASNGSTRSRNASIQVAVDNVAVKRTQLSRQGYKVSAMKRQPRGDVAFEWRDPDGYIVRFVGPWRKRTDKSLE